MPVFRRRPIPARWRAARRVGLAAQPGLLRLQQAHRLMAEGAYVQAAAVFAELSDDAAVHAVPRSAQLSIQAGRAWVMAGDLPKGCQRLLLGLTRMGEMGQAGRMPMVASRLLAELRARGFEADAHTLQTELMERFPGLQIPATGPGAASGGAAQARRLPAKCPYCGGNINPELVDWLDENSAACEYCGSTLQTDE